MLGGDGFRRSTRDPAFCGRGYNEETRILTENRSDLEALAKGLLESNAERRRNSGSAQGKKPNRESVLEPTTPALRRAAGWQAAPAPRPGRRLERSRQA